MQRLPTLDTSFLRVETPSARMHVGATGPVWGRHDLERLADGYLSRQLDRDKPLRQVVVVPRLGPRTSTGGGFRGA
jgi:hypothetical protein